MADYVATVCHMDPLLFYSILPAPKVWQDFQVWWRHYVLDGAQDQWSQEDHVQFPATVNFNFKSSLSTFCILFQNCLDLWRAT